MAKSLKNKMTDEMRERYAQMRDCVLVRFEGMDVQTADGLRSHLRRSGVSLKVVNNNLASLVLRELDFKVDENLFKGPTAVAWGGQDAVAAPKAVSEWIRASKTKAVLIKGGYLDKAPLSAKKVKELADIPPRPVLLAMLLGVFKSPAAQLVGALTSHQRKFVGLLNALIEKMEKKAEEGHSTTAI